MGTLELYLQKSTEPTGVQRVYFYLDKKKTLIVFESLELALTNLYRNNISIPLRSICITRQVRKSSFNRKILNLPLPIVRRSFNPIPCHSPCMRINKSFSRADGKSFFFFVEGIRFVYIFCRYITSVVFKCTSTMHKSLLAFGMNKLVAFGRALAM